jgi:uncharacterized Ntn-hydrolase superfamily protein
MTFSLLGRCEDTGRLGMVISSSSPAVAARCAHARPTVGIAASQNVTDPRLGPALLDALAGVGMNARAAVDQVVGDAPHIEHRQLLLLGASGEGAAYTGSAALGTHGSRTGASCVAGGNLLADDTVLDAMVASFEAGTALELGDRLIGVLAAGANAGGEAGAVHSAGVLMTGEVAWPIVDLRVDWHDDPVTELAAVWEVYKPQLDDYVTRALNPGAAPGYGVPGE